MPFSLPPFSELMAHEKFPALLALAAITVVLLFASILRLCLRHSRKSPSEPAGPAVVTGMLLAVTVLVLVITGLCAWSFYQFDLSQPEPTEPPTQPTQTQAPTTLPPETTVPTEPPETTEPLPTDPLLNFHPHMVDSSNPENWGIKWEIIADDEIVESYTRETAISFGEPESYYSFQGVSTFRGNNFRNDPTYGSATVIEETLTSEWLVYNGSLNGWPGCGWTGQPLVTKWDAETKQLMNLFDSKKEKEDLVEVVYATLDGYVYFIDLDDGSYTRDPIYVGQNMKGSGSLDPRGYPLLYVGSGDVFNGNPRMYVISLIDGNILYERGYGEAYAPRGWSGFDSAPLVSAETDTLIWPGENGLLYTIHLNTQYDPAAGTISIDPDEPVMTRYSSDRSDGYSYWMGMEDSVIMVGQYLYIADNAGMFFCVDINTMELIWAQDTKDDNNATPVFEWGEDGNGYLYTAPSLHWTASGSTGQVSVYKLDAQTGEILWEHSYDCNTIEDLSGGIQSSPVLGREDSSMEGLVIFSVSYTPYYPDGILTALDTETGETVWTVEMDSYSWCSPVAVYTEDGKGYVLISSFNGTFYLIDGATGDVLDVYRLGSHMEASPVVYENRVVVGSRGSEIICLKIN